MGEVGGLGDHPGHGGLQVHHPGGDLLVIELHSDQETEFAIELEQDLLAAKWIVRRSRFDQLTFSQKLPGKQRDGAAAQVGERVNTDARDRALLVNQGLDKVFVALAFFLEDGSPPR
jgi:hypothetical protein